MVNSSSSSHLNHNSFDSWYEVGAPILGEVAADGDDCDFHATSLPVLGVFSSTRIGSV